MWMYIEMSTILVYYYDENMKQTLQSRLLHYVTPYLSSGILILSYLITASFRLLPLKLLRNK